MSNEIEAVIWDMGGVLVRTLDPSGRQKWEQRLGMKNGRLGRLIFFSEIATQASLGQAQPEDIWRWVSEQLKLSPEETEQLRLDFFVGDAVDHQLVDYIRGLRRQRKTALLSNAWNDLRHWLENEWRIADAFDRILISAEVGLMKPDPRIYQMLLEDLQVPPERAIFVDDFPENIEAARALGMLAVHFKDPETARAQIDSLLTDQA